MGGRPRARSASRSSRDGSDPVPTWPSSVAWTTPVPSEVVHERVAEVDAERVADHEHPQLGAHARRAAGRWPCGSGRSWSGGRRPVAGAWREPAARAVARLVALATEQAVRPDTTWDSPRPRLSAAMGPTGRATTVRRVPTGETWALCWRVGASSTSQSSRRPSERRSAERPSPPRRLAACPGRLGCATRHVACRSSAGRDVPRTDLGHRTRPPVAVVGARIRTGSR